MRASATRQAMELALPDPYENEYLEETIKCAQHGFLRAAADLGSSSNH